VGIAGAGAIAQIAHLPAYRRLRNVRVTALCDTDPTKLRVLSSKHGIPLTFRAYEELLASREVDAVDICLPTPLHRGGVLAALAAGKHVLCEKPLALRSDDVQQILDAQAGSGVKLLVALNVRFRDDSILLKRFIEAGQIGEPFFIRTGWLKRRQRITPTRWRYRKEISGGGVFWDLGIQLLDVALWLADYPTIDRVAASFVYGTADVDVEDSAFAFLAGADLAIAIETSWKFILDHDFHYLTAFGPRGTGQLAPLRLFRLEEDGIRDVTGYLRPSRNVYLESYQRMIAYFVEAVAGREEPPPLEEQLKLARIMERIETAAGVEMVRPAGDAQLV
jgi:predicted dehydrogenase